VFFIFVSRNFFKVGKKKRRTGLDRELAALQEANRVPESPVAPVSKPLSLKEKWNSAPKAERWVFKPYTSMRKDKAEFCHWKKLRDNSEDDFSKYNKHIPIYNYNEADYNDLLINPSWTKPETDHLLQLASIFNCRFIAIHDRWEMKERTIEELKDRFFFVQRKMIQLNGMRSGDPNWQIHPLVKFPYDKEQDEIRKKQLLGILKRDKKQVKEEDELTPKVKEILRMFKSNRREGTKVNALVDKILQTSFSETPNKRGRNQKKI